MSRASGEQMLMDKSTQYNGKQEFDWARLIRRLAKFLVVICGLMSLYILHRMGNGKMPCTCTNEAPCFSPGSFLWRFLMRLLASK